MDFDPRHWIEFLGTHPVVLVAILGWVSGMAATQAVKMTWLAWGNTSIVSRARYRNACMWLAVLSTGAITHFWWMYVIGANGSSHGLREIASTSNGVVSPFLYWGLKTGLRIWKPEWAAKIGDNGAEWKDAGPK